MTTLFRVEEAAEEGRRVEFGPEMELLAKRFMRKTALRTVVFLIIVFQQEGIRYLPAHKVKTAVKTNQSTSSHVPNEAIVLNGDVACGRVFSTSESD